MTATSFDTLPAHGAYLQTLRDAGSLCSAQRGDALSREGEHSQHISVVASGYVVAVKRTATGLQQNVALYVPGDMVDHESFTLGMTRCSAVALAPVTYHRIPHTQLREIIDTNPGHARSFWRYVAFHGALAQEWLLSLGRRSAYARTAHFLCEIIHRASLAEDEAQTTCPMPLTQTELADTLGLSVVHVNRTLMRLRQEGLIRLRRGQIDVLDWARFKEAAGFEATYLKLVA